MIAGLIGVIHLRALPGDPGCSSEEALRHGFEPMRGAALRDAEALVGGGVDGLIIENFGSAPFPKGDASQRLPPHQIAALTLITREIMLLFPQARSGAALSLGVNCLRNDVIAALGIAAACGLGRPGKPGFVRVNVHTGAYLTDQGVIEGEAYHSLRYRQTLAASDLRIFADVLVKHAAPLVPLNATAATHDCIDRGLADGVIVTGQATGAAVDRDLLKQVADAAGDKPVLIGSGFTPRDGIRLAPLAHGAIVGTWVKEQGALHRPVDLDRVRQLVDAAAGRFRQQGI
jgi:membrane complex biogenesis BtpA family protein